MFVYIHIYIYIYTHRPTQVTACAPLHTTYVHLRYSPSIEHMTHEKASEPNHSLPCCMLLLYVISTGSHYYYYYYYYY